MKQAFSVILLLFIAHFAKAQEGDTRMPVYHFNGSVSVTNNGFSLIPTFSLGKPAAIADLGFGFVPWCTRGELNTLCFRMFN